MAHRYPEAIDTGPSGSSTRLALLMWGVLILAQLSPTTPTPWGQRIVPTATLLLAGLLTWGTARTVRLGFEELLAAPLMRALMIAALGSVIVGLVQVFMPSWADGNIVAYPTTPGRAIGNVRQPNQLSTLLLWGSVALLWWGVVQRWASGWIAALLVLTLFSVVLTASRTGTVGVVMLSLWGLIDRRWPRTVRWLLIAALPIYLLGWWGMEHWAAISGDAFYGNDQVNKTLHGDPSSSRGKIWSNTLAMIAAHPWAGTGAGAFNFVWTMTPFPDRPVAFFDHSHNLPLQLAAEFGIPMALLILGLFGGALWQARSALFHSDDTIVRSARTALFMLALVGVHSMLEYPLWYIYFLLPMAVMLGWLTGLADLKTLNVSRSTPKATVTTSRKTWILQGAGALALVGTLWATYAYHAVVIIFEPSLAIGRVAPLQERIEQGQHSWLFGQHADYADVTMADQPEEVFASFERPLFHLIDTRLMMAYAQAWAGRGERDKARHIAARLKEFHNPASTEFFAPCLQAPEPASGPRPFQCDPDPGLRAQDLLVQAASRPVP
ncbi:Wzy polymerase domain-containing protein [Leptothrix ochracea]|uniref:PglL family O-oligosaccharyltransferase n=1 Tax=Leptothrix ochracea TaxID=735331 RepID=UPI0034E2E0B8